MGADHLRRPLFFSGTTGGWDGWEASTLPAVLAAAAAAATRSLCAMTFTLTLRLWWWC